MDAGSSCFCLLCHPSAKTCQFHYHASVTRMGHRPGLPKTEKLCIYLRACLCKTKHDGSATTLSNKQMPVWFMPTPDRGKETVLRAQTCRKRIYFRPTLSFTHTHKNVCVHGVSVNDGWQYDVCVRSKRIGITTWAKSAANSSRLLTKLFLCLVFFFPVFFFLFS